MFEGCELTNVNQRKEFLRQLTSLPRLERPTTQNGYTIIIVLFIALGILLRLYKLSFQSYWLDEVLILKHILGGNFWSLLRTGLWGDPPLYEILMYFWVGFLGSAEASTRFFSSLFGIFSLPLMYLLTKKLFDHRVAVSSTFLLTFSAYHISYSQEARMYVFAWFFVLASTLFFIELIMKGGKLNWAMYVITSILAFYAHYSFLFILLVHNIFIVVFQRRYTIRLKSWWASQAAIIILCLPWICFSVVPHVLLRGFLMKMEFQWIPPTTYKDILNTFAFFILGQEWMVLGYTTTYESLYKVSLFIAGLSILSNVWFIIKSRTSSFQKQTVFFTLLWCLLPIVLLYICSICLWPCYVVKYVGVSYLALYILIAYTINRIYPLFLKTAVLMFFVIVNIYILTYYYDFPVKEQWKDSAQQIYAAKTSHDAIIVSSDLYGVDAFTYYYSGNRPVKMCTQDNLTAMLENNIDFWFIMSRWTDRDVIEVITTKTGTENFRSNYFVKEKILLDTLKCFLLKRKEHM
jgi:uncharacterized membrane protein